MNTLRAQAARISARLLPTALACSLFASGAVLADEHTFTIGMHLSSRGLDLTKPADAQTFYQRIQHAADVVCTHGNRVDLAPVEYELGCYEKALGDAIASLNSPLLTQIYLDTHTLRQAAAHSIQVPAQLAAK
jgi:UrcA family protein